jgi:hypothetical protein
MQPLPPFPTIPAKARNPDGSVNGGVLLPFTIDVLDIGGQCRTQLGGLQGAVRAMQDPKAAARDNKR